MLLVKPTWNSLQIQGSGLNLLALPRDMGLENQEVDEFEILGMEKPELFIESLETISYEKPTILQKIQVLIPLSENKIDKRDNIRIYGIKKEPEVKIVEKIVEKKVERKVVPNKILKVDKITLKGEEKLDVKKIIKLGSVHLKGRKKTDIRKKVNEDMFQIEGLEKEEYINEIIYVDDIQILGKQKKEEKKVIKNKISKVDKIQLLGMEKEEKEPEENIEENIVEITIFGKEKEKKIEVEKIIKHEFSDLNIDKGLVVELEGTPQIVEQKQEMIVKNVEEKDWNKMISPEKATKLLIKNSYDKVTVPQQIIENEEVETVEKVYKDWNSILKPIKSTKLNVKGVQKLWDDLEMEQNDQFKLIFKTKPQIKIIEKEVIKEKEKEEFDIENFAINIIDSVQKLRESHHIEKILLPSKSSQFNLLAKKKPEIVLKSIKENKLFIQGKENEKINWNDINALSKESNFKFIHIKKPSKEIKQESNEKIRTVEKIVEVEKQINWNEVNKIEKKGRLDLLSKKKSNKYCKTENS